MNNDLPELKCDLLTTLTQGALDEEKASYSHKIESFAVHSKRKLAVAKHLDSEFIGRLSHGAQLVREHFSQLGGEDVT